jgi:hypothetical protein
LCLAPGLLALREPALVAIERRAELGEVAFQARQIAPVLLQERVFGRGQRGALLLQALGATLELRQQLFRVLAVRALHLQILIDAGELVAQRVDAFLRIPEAVFGDRQALRLGGDPHQQALELSARFGMLVLPVLAARHRLRPLRLGLLDVGLELHDLALDAGAVVAQELQLLLDPGPTPRR